MPQPPGPPPTCVLFFIQSPPAQSKLNTTPCTTTYTMSTLVNRLPTAAPVRGAQHGTCAGFIATATALYLAARLPAHCIAQSCHCSSVEFTRTPRATGGCGAGARQRVLGGVGSLLGKERRRCKGQWEAASEKEGDVFWGVETGREREAHRARGHEKPREIWPERTRRVGCWGAKKLGACCEGGGAGQTGGVIRDARPAHICADTGAADPSIDSFC
jgi:hypothetical protein